jgi:hypothetical protein
MPADIGYAFVILAKMSSGHYCVIRDLGLVKGGKGLRHHEVVLDLSWRGCWRGVFRFATSADWQDTAAGEAGEPVLATQASRRSRR